VTALQKIIFFAFCFFWPHVDAPRAAAALAAMLLMMMIMHAAAETSSCSATAPAEESFYPTHRSRFEFFLKTAKPHIVIGYCIWDLRTMLRTIGARFLASVQSVNVKVTFCGG